MAQTSLNISLPEQLKHYIEARVAEGEYGTPSEYLRELIREDRKRQKASLEARLLEAIESRTISISPSELKKNNLIDLLQSKLAKLPKK